MLGDDFYTELNAQWNVAVIAKPTKWTVNHLDAGAVTMRELLILSEEEGSFKPGDAGRSFDRMEQRFEIHGRESTEANCRSMMAETKGILKAYTGGTYQVSFDRYKIVKDLNSCRWMLGGFAERLLASRSM